ncbi:MAG: glycosyltransferase family 4 protein [Candidatus Binataceae bacterium]
MRILLLVEQCNAVGGIAEAVEGLALKFIGYGHAVMVGSTLDPGARDNHYERVPAGHVDCTYIDIWNRKPLTHRHLETLYRIPYNARFGDLARLLRSWRPDIVNSHLYAWDRYPTVMSACRSARLPLVQSFHVADDRGRGRLGLKGLASLAQARGFTTTCARARDYFARLLPQAQGAAVIIGGVDAAAVQTARPFTRSRPYIICACRLYLEHKAIDVLIYAFMRIARAFPGIDLLIAGGGPDRTKVEALVSGSGLGSRIELLGVKSQDELRSLYKGALLFAMPSRSGETVPLVYQESLAAGIPVVATDSGGTSELVQNGVNGFIVQEEDVAAFAQSIACLLRDPKMRAEMGQRGRETVLANHTWAKCALRYDQLFRSCLSTACAWPRYRQRSPG